MDTIFFIASKLIGALLRPDTWIILAMAVIVLALVMNRRRLALWVGGVSLALLVALAILPLGDLLLQPIERTFPAEPALDKIDGIVVLGGGENVRASAFWGQMQLNEGAERYTIALALARRFPQARLLFIGGSGALRDLGGAETSEADIAGRYFLDQGVAPTRLLLEGQSRNTAENAHLSLALATPAPEETWVLVTSAFHMPRAMRSFEAAGWTGLVPWPVDYRTSAFTDGVGWNLTDNLGVLNTSIREHVGQIAYRLFER
ncbi:MAG: YdcF family protein [Roseovarius sp.]